MVFGTSPALHTYTIFLSSVFSGITATRVAHTVTDTVVFGARLGVVQIIVG